MNVLCVSDVVVKELVDSQHDPGMKVDLIIACGDLPPEYLRSLHYRFAVPLFFVLGNHDIRHDTAPAGCINITGRIVSHQDVNVLGFSGSRWYNGNQNQYREHEMRSQIRRLWLRLWLLKHLDVVVTHAPPRRVHDGEDRCHKGFNCYNTLIRRHAPRYFIHGHIHRQFADESERVSMVGETAVINTYGYHLLVM
ncbi:MAG: metallophosphoesterase [Desulfocapsaceae bacterium]|jgi:Icc-related predicted phosphoesterase|nr:metallophosphoesterase [Desulfocapsaceae bacterium]